MYSHSKFSNINNKNSKTIKIWTWYNYWCYCTLSSWDENVNVSQNTISQADTEPELEVIGHNIFRCKSNSGSTNVCLSIHLKSKPLNSIKSILPSFTTIHTITCNFTNITYQVSKKNISFLQLYHWTKVMFLGTPGPGGAHWL